jgi:carbon-monoxide dehydrogenase large subunit
MSAEPVHAPAVGRSLLRREDARLLRGRGRYVDDIELPRSLHAVVVRSPYAHACIRRVDGRAAMRLPGVAAVLTSADLGVSHKPIPIRLCPDPRLRGFLQYPLARERVRYAGEPVAVLVAETRALAEDASAAVEVEYEPLPVVADAEAPPPATLFEAAPDNVASSFVQAFGEIEEAFDRADRVVRTRFNVARHTGMPVETRGLAASYDAGCLRVWGPTKVTHFNRSVLADLLGLAEDRVHLVEPDVGGGFGVRGEFYPEDLLVPLAAMRLGRPVKWVEDRLEHLVATNHSRQQAYELELAVRADGILLGLRVRLVVDMGAYLRTHGTIVPGLSAGMLPGPYRLGSYRCEVRCVLTNKTPTGTYRAPGRFEANAARERLLDLAAAELGLDPVGMRARNLLSPDALPHRVGTHILGEAVVYDSGDYPLALERAVVLSGLRERLGQRRARGRHRVGYGLAAFVEKTGTGPFEGARVRIDAAGRVLVATGAASVGQGVETSLSQIAADALGVDVARITVRHGDTDLIPHGIGTFASRTTVMAGSAVHGACRALRARLLRAAADALGVPAETLELTGDGVRATGGGSCSLGALAARAASGSADAPAEAGLEVVHYFRTRQMTYSHGVVVAEVTVDTGTGWVSPRQVWLVYDVGKAINPRIVAGQVEGGVIQGIGGALLEELHYDPEGQLLTGSLMEYLLPGVADMPRIIQERLERSPSRLNPLGVKGAGEIGIAGVGGAIANAVADALGDAGDAVCELPITPERVWRWLAVAADRAA